MKKLAVEDLWRESPNRLTSRPNSMTDSKKCGIETMNKKALTEADIRTKFITPALVGADGNKWNVMTQLREEIYFTKGRVIVRGKTVKRGEAKKVDYLLYYKPNIPIAVIEAKDNNHNKGCSGGSP